MVLQVKKGDAWATVLEKNTAADGSYAFTVPEPTAGTFVYRVKKNGVDGHPTAYSPQLTITVVKGFVVTAKARPTTIKLGKKSRIAGTVTPKLASANDRAVQLQVKKGSAWKKVANGRTQASGAYSFSVKPTKKGTVSYRVMKAAAEGKRAAYSTTVKVKVTRQ